MMKVLDTKILDGKKLFLIEDTPIKAEAGVNANPYYVPINSTNYSENTRTKLTPKVELTVQEKNQLKQSPTALFNIKTKSEKEKKERLAKSESAYQKRIKTGIQSSQDLADETGAIGDKISLQNIPGVGQYIPDMLDVTGGLGSMASNLGALPSNLNRGNYGQALLSVAAPLTTGALAGLGTQNTSQFVNNLINPLAGIKLKANLPEGTVQNGFSLSKLNERINLEPNELMGTNAYKIKLKDKWIGDFQLEKSLKDEGKIAIGNVYIKEPYRGKGFGKQVFTEGNKLLNDTEQGVLHSSGFFEGNDAKHVWNSLVKEGKAEQIGKDAWRFIEKSPSSKNFKSEIDWGKWNKEIPENTQLMKEYNTIEQASKAKGTWMKNPDGSAFQGSPEQFVQQNSENFKKAFPEGAQTTYRGTQAFNPTLSESLKGAKGSNFHIIFGTSNESVAENYATHTGYNLEDEFQKIGKRPNYYHPDKSVPGTYTGYKEDVNPGMYQLAVGNDLKSIKADGMGKSWVNVENKEVLNWLKNKDPEIANRRVGSSYLPDKVMTDDIASYMVDKKIPVGKVTNVYDGADFFGNKVLSDVTMLNPTIARVKSLKYNNGMFDMTNPNIYKTIVGGLATGALGKEAVKKQEFGGKIKILKTKISNGKTLHLIDY